MELVMEQEAPAGEVCLTPEAMDAYLDTLRQQGRSADTLAAYRRSIYGLYRSLPPDKRVGRGTLDRWRETLEDQGYLPRTINVRLAAANGLMTYLGHRELQATAALPPPAEGERPELTRGEYLRLLSTARVLEKERLYLLVKVFGSTGLSVGELPRLTAERAGRGLPALAATTTLYGQRVPLSATKLDKLHACHFQHFLKFGLNAKPRQRAKFQAADYGTFVHFVLEQVLRQAVEEPGGVSALHADAALRWQRVEEAAARYITESLRGLEGETGRFRYLFTRMLRAVHQVVDSAVAELAVSDFQPVAFELGFGRGEGKAMPPIRAENGVEVQVSGYVDRVDAWLHNGTRYLRVVDYKTGKKEFSFTDVKHGMGLQMLLYLFALEKQGQGLFGPEEIVPAGVLYFPARTPIVNGSRSMSDQAIADAVDRDLVRRGVVLGEPEVLQAMEHTEGNFRYLPVGNRGDWLLTAEQMEQLGRLVSDDLKAVAGELAAGNIDADPFWRGERENACQWCDYAQACHFEPVCGDRVRWQKGLSAREFWAALGGDDQPEEDDHGL